jgi:hypothetical protein
MPLYFFLALRSSLASHILTIFVADPVRIIVPKYQTFSVKGYARATCTVSTEAITSV